MAIYFYHWSESQGGPKKIIRNLDLEIGRSWVRAVESPTLRLCLKWERDDYGLKQWIATLSLAHVR